MPFSNRNKDTIQTISMRGGHFSQREYYIHRYFYWRQVSLWWTFISGLSKNIEIHQNLRKVSSHVPNAVLGSMYLSLFYPSITYVDEVRGAIAVGQALPDWKAYMTGASNGLLPVLPMIPSINLYTNKRQLPLPDVHQLFVHVKFYQYFILGESSTYLFYIIEISQIRSHLTRFRHNIVWSMSPIFMFHTIIVVPLSGY